MKKETTACLLALLCAAHLVASAPYSVGIPEQCCFDFFNGKIPVKKIADFKTTNTKCSTSAVIFKTTRNKLICMRADNVWVKSTIEFLKKQRSKGSKKERQYEGSGLRA